MILKISLPLSFQTLPDSSNGSLMPCEHIVLCGSKKFPVKDPFFSMTPPQFKHLHERADRPGFYRLSSQFPGRKRFLQSARGLSRCRFSSLIKHLSFLQEAHRLSFTTPGDVTSPLQRQGVVYNEMKGAMSASDDRLSFHLYSPSHAPILPTPLTQAAIPKKSPLFLMKSSLNFTALFIILRRCLYFFTATFPWPQHLDFIEKRALANVPKFRCSPLFPCKNVYRAMACDRSLSIGPTEEPAKKTLSLLAC